jgi:hypothetical protein
MPAIELAKLRLKATEIAGLMNEPAMFISEATKLFEFYADQTRKDGIKSMPTSITQMYSLPTPVMRRIKYELINEISQNQEVALTLADELWHLSHFEFKELSAFLLGNLHVDNPEVILLRLKKWNMDTTDETVQHLLAGEGTRALRIDHFSEFKELCIQWLRLEKDEYKRTGLFLLEDYLSLQEFAALPTVFSILRREMNDIPNSFYPYYRALFKKIIPLSQPESTYFLRQQALMAPDDTQIVKLIRQSLDLFEEDYQKILQSVIKKAVV